MGLPSGIGIDAHVWAAVTWKFDSWYLRPPAKKEHPRTKSKFDRIEPSILATREKDASVCLARGHTEVCTMRNSPVDVCESKEVQRDEAEKTLQQSSDADNDLDLHAVH